MKRIILTLALGTVFCCTTAFAEIKSCDELKAEIAAKLDAKGVKEYTLEIITNDQVKDQKVVGSCEGGTKKSLIPVIRAKSNRSFCRSVNRDFIDDFLNLRGIAASHNQRRCA